MIQEHREDSAASARIPAVGWIRGYRPSWLRSDLLAEATQPGRLPPVYPTVADVIDALRGDRQPNASSDSVSDPG